MKVLCYHCHINFWHLNPVESGEWFKKTFPERWKYLQANRGTYKFTLTELEDKVKELEKLAATIWL